MAAKEFVEAKRCVRCDRVKLLAEFYTGLGTCIECRTEIRTRSELSTKRRRDNRQWIKLNLAMHPHKGYPCACANKWCRDGIGPKDRCECMPKSGCTECATMWVEAPIERRRIANGSA